MLEGIAHRDYDEANRQYFMVRSQPVKKRNSEANFPSSKGALPPEYTTFGDYGSSASGAPEKGPPRARL